MKKIFIVLIILMIGVSGAFAQVNVTDMQDSFSTFSSDVSTSLPFASTIGLNWSDATVRSFPHFGAGLSVGAVLIPEDAFTTLAADMGFDIPPELTSLGIGIPLPAYTFDARMGGLFLPFDIGVKFGFIPSEVASQLPISVDYTLAGFDLRMPIMKQNIVLPSIALSVGYNYLSAGVETPISTGMGQSVDITDAFGSGSHILYFGDPDARFQMDSNVLDAKLQISKSLLIITPYAGVGYSYGWSNAGGGVVGSVRYNDGTGEHDITADDIAAIEQAFADAGYDAPTLSADGFLVSSDSVGGSFRAFAGLSVNLFVLKLDLNAMYNVDTASFGGGVNARIAF
ncbi:MAG: hypothetical protein DRP58_05700 [Spirochaetes bacterium]|nr:MAG: hypothetical protein DRP58_05700 [Spirochaetota bacterium]